MYGLHWHHRKKVGKWVQIMTTHLYNRKIAQKNCILVLKPLMEQKDGFKADPENIRLTIKPPDLLRRRVI